MTKEKIETVADDTLITTAKEFIAGAATTTGDNIYSVRGSDLEKFLAAQGIPKEIQKKRVAVLDAIMAAAIDYNGEKLVSIIETKKAAGEDPEAVSVTTQLNYREGRVAVMMDPHVSRKVPTHLPSMQGKTIEGDGFSHHFGAVSVKVNAKTSLGSRTEQLQSWETTIKTVLGL